MFREGDDASAIFLVLTGTLAISTTSQRTVHTLRSGDVVGERAVIAHTTRGSTVAADTASELLCFPAAAYRRICGSRAERKRASWLSMRCGESTRSAANLQAATP